MDKHTRDAIWGASICGLLAVACWASGSATPVFVIFAVIGLVLLAAML